MVAAVFVGSLGLVGYVAWHFRFELSDDAFIHLRIVHNLVRTGHPDFNPGEHVMVSSSPVWALWLALSEFIFGINNIVWLWTAIFTSLAAAAAYWLAWTWVESRSREEKILAFLLPIAVITTLADSVFLGLETPLAIALMLLAAVAFVRSSALALPLLALAAFTRYELAALFAVAGLVCLARRKAKKYGVIPAAVITGALTSWLLSEYGTIFPNSIKAKGRSFMVTASDTFAALSPEPSFLSAFGNALLLVGLVVLVSWLVEPVLEVRRREGARITALSLILWGFTLGALYVWKKTFIFPWYKPLVWAPVLAGTLLMILIDHFKPRRIIALFIAAVFFLVPYAFLGFWVRVALTQGIGSVPAIRESGRVHVYLDLAVGKALHQVCPQSQLMTSEIGGLGYGFQGYILDGIGLASPEAIKYHPMRVPQERSSHFLGAIPPGFVLEKKPDLIVTIDIFGEAVSASRGIREECDDLRFYPVLPQEASEGLAPAWSIKALHVLVKKAGGCPVSRVNESLSAILQARQ